MESFCTNATCVRPQSVLHEHLHLHSLWRECLLTPAGVVWEFQRGLAASSSVLKLSHLSVFFIFYSLLSTQVTIFGFFKQIYLKYFYLLILLVLQQWQHGCTLWSHICLMNSWYSLFIMNSSLDLIFLICSLWIWTICTTSPFTDCKFL